MKTPPHDAEMMIDDGEGPLPVTHVRGCCKDAGAVVRLIWAKDLGPWLDSEEPRP